MTEKDAYMNAIKASNNYNDCLLDIVEEQERGNKITKEVLQRSKEMRSHHEKEIEQLKDQLTERGNVGLQLQMELNELKKTYGMAKSLIERINERVEQLENDTDKLQKEIEQLSKDRYKAETEVSNLKEERKNRLERLGEAQAKASKANAEKLKLMALIRDLPYTNKVASLWETFDKWLKQRRKKSKKGGKCE